LVDFALWLRYVNQLKDLFRHAGSYTNIPWAIRLSPSFRDRGTVTPLERKMMEEEKSAEVLTLLAAAEALKNRLKKEEDRLWSISAFITGTLMEVYDLDKDHIKDIADILEDYFAATRTIRFTVQAEWEVDIDVPWSDDPELIDHSEFNVDIDNGYRGLEKIIEINLEVTNWEERY